MPRAKAACYRASGKLRSPQQRLKMFNISETYILEFLKPWTRGNVAPALASERGEAVWIDIKSKSTPWSKLSHLGDNDMMRFNIGLADTIYAGLLAIDRARQWEGEETSMDLRLYQPHSFPP